MTTGGRIPPSSLMIGAEPKTSMVAASSPSSAALYVEEETFPLSKVAYTDQLKSPHFPYQ